MHVPGLGEVTQDEGFDDWLRSEPVPVPMFGGQPCRIVLEGYADDPDQDAFHAAVANLLAATPAVLRAADEPLFRYYKDFEEYWVGDGHAPIASADELWRHVRLGDEPMVSRRPHGDRGVYVSVECGCDWEEEHGLQLVFKGGLRVTKLGGYDGHLSNADAFADGSLEDVVYR